MILGSNMSVRWPQAILRTALGVVLIAAGVALLEKADTGLVPYALGVSAFAFVGLFALQYLLRREVEADPEEQRELERERRFAAAAGADREAARPPVLAGAKD